MIKFFVLKQLIFHRKTGSNEYGRMVKTPGIAIGEILTELNCILKRNRITL